jgi:integrase
MTLTGTGRNFEAWLVEQNYAPATVRSYVGYCRRAEHAVGPLEGASADGWATLPTSASARNGARKALVAWYRSRGVRTGGPAVELPARPEPDLPPRPVRGDVFDRLQDAAAALGGMHEVAAVLLAGTGCRVSEARLARWDQFVLDGDPVWEVAGKGRRRKGPKLRTMPLHESAVRVLRGWRRDCGSGVWVFGSPVRPGRPVVDTTMRAIVYRIAEAAGVDERVNPHRWRHTFATAVLDSSRDLAAVQDLLGHDNPATTRRYTLVKLDRMRQAVDGTVRHGRLRAVS